MQPTNSITYLINHVKQVNKKHDDFNRLTGRSYNIFEILELTSNEVRLHSNFIANLLNPKGNHGQGSKYLELFLKLINIRIKELNYLPEQTNLYNEATLDITSVRTEVELPIGKKTNEDGGRIDIICQDKFNRAIIIENKIFAGDQPNQLLRYFNFKPQATLIYLTLFGDVPAEISLGNKKHTELKIITLSYEDDMINWLEQCLKESYQLSLIRETILQYQQTIKKLTNKIEVKEMDNEIVSLITQNGDNINAAIMIEKSIQEAKALLLKNFGIQLMKRLESKYSTTSNISIDDDFGKRFKGIRVIPKISSKVYFQISFITNFKDCYLEIFNSDNEEKILKKISKESDSIQFYKSELNNLFKNPNKVENVKNAWYGDWFCRYFKFDNYLNETGWTDFANKNYEITDWVIDDLSNVIDTMMIQLMKTIQ